jgi:hypothetical protein
MRIKRLKKERVDFPYEIKVMWRLESNTDSSKEDGQSLKRKEHRSPKGTKNAKLSNM